MERTGMTGEIAVVLLWVAIVAIVVILLGGAAAAMVWDPNSRRRARATGKGAALPVASMPSPHDSWPRRL
jgi:flagellar basal body-associated protein FliL